MIDIYFSRQRKIELEAELQQLKSVERASIAADIETAKSHGDLSENAEYHAARERQAKLEDRIRELEYTLNHGKIVEISSNDIVSIGHSVLVEEVGGNLKTYTIVGSEEQDFLSGKISHSSPLAMALLGSKVGDKVTFTTPAGENNLIIKEIKS